MKIRNVPKNLYCEIKNILAQARNKTYKVVNLIMVQSYWNIGRLIVESEQKGHKRAKYGSQLLENLSARLSQDFGKGFDPTNLWNMRKLYLTFPILDALRRELSWTHYRLLLRVENNDARNFYLNESADSGWSTRQMERQINSSYFERILTSKNKLLVKREADLSAKQLPIKVEDQVKDPFVLEFLGLKSIPCIKESRLEQALVDHLQKFLLELGRGFSFVERQMRISTETKHFYIDLVFYNYILKCFVLIDLKTGDLSHQDIGQMDMYVRLFEGKIKRKSDNPTIGIILCAEKDETIVRYSVIKDNKKLFASKYKLYLPTKKELIDEVEKDKLLLLLSSKKKEVKNWAKKAK